LISSFLLATLAPFSRSVLAAPPPLAPNASQNSTTDPDLKSGFPIAFAQAAGGFGGQSNQMVVGNIDADPQLEIMLSGSGNPASVAAWNYDGTVVSGWPRTFAGNTYLAIGKLSTTLPGLQVLA